MPKPFGSEKISPNFTNEVSRLAEQRLRELIEKARELGVEIFSLETGKEEILDRVKKDFPKRYELVLQKLREEGLSLSDLPKNLLLDRLLGVDLLFTFQGKNYAADVTSGKHTVVLNKEKSSVSIPLKDLIQIEITSKKQVIRGFDKMWDFFICYDGNAVCFYPLAEIL